MSAAQRLSSAGSDLIGKFAFTQQVHANMM